MKGFRWPWSTQTAVAEPVPSPDDVWQRRTTRAQRRRAALQQKKMDINNSARVCWRCGFGPLRGIKNSNLVRMKDNEMQEAWGHASPVVCAGAVRAVTSQTRDSVKEAFADFRGILLRQIEAYARLYWAHLLKFLREDAGGNSPAHPLSRRGNSSRAGGA